TISSPLAVTELFGTSRTKGEGDVYRGNLRERLRILASNLCSYTSKSFDSDSGYDVTGGDGGLDIVSYIPLDGMPYIPVSFAQCACSQEEWENKQLSIADSI